MEIDLYTPRIYRYSYSYIIRSILILDIYIPCTDKEITGGKIHATVHLGLLDLEIEKMLCDFLERFDASCPLKKGPLNLEWHVQNSGTVPEVR